MVSAAREEEKTTGCVIKFASEFWFIIVVVIFLHVCGFFGGWGAERDQRGLSWLDWSLWNLSILILRRLVLMKLQ